MRVAKTGATYQDVLDAPEHMVAELIDGDLLLSPRPGGPHTRVATVVSRELGGPFDDGSGGPGGWIILMEPELHFGTGNQADVLVPDLAGWRRTRMSKISKDSYFTLAPDWICEVLSVSTQRTDRMRKMPIYSAAGVSHVWLINPAWRSLEVFRRESDKWLLTLNVTGDVCVRAEPFDAVELDLARWWRDIPQPDRASDAAFAYEYGQ